MGKRKPIPPKDSWLAIKPGQTVEVDARLSSEWSREKRKARDLRGLVLATAFEVESGINRLLSEILIPERAESATIHGMTKTDRKQLLDLMMQSGALSFNQKVRLLRDFSGDVPALAALLPEGLWGKLDKVREFRNDFAHHPVSIEVEGEPPNQTVHAVLACGHRDIRLDNDFASEYYRAAGSLIDGFESALAELSGAKSS